MYLHDIFVSYNSYGPTIELLKLNEIMLNFVKCISKIIYYNHNSRNVIRIQYFKPVRPLSMEDFLRYGISVGELQQYLPIQHR